MYKVLVVDDEKNIRERLVKSFPWNEAGFQVIGSAGDGQEALELIKEYLPHVVLTDIRMPEMNGLELAKAIQETYPHIKVLILSAYDDFKYAQEAIRYGIKGYLLKPVMKDEIVDAMSGLAIELKIDEEMAYSKKIGIPGILEESMLIDLVKGENVHQYDEPWLRDYMRVIVCSFGKWFEADLGLSIRSFIAEKTTEYWKESHTSVLFYGNQLILFAHDTRPISKYDLKGKIEDYYDLLKASIMSGFGKECSLSISVGNMIKGPEQICTSFNQAIYAFSYKYFDVHHSVLFYQDLLVTGSDETFTEQANEHLNIIMDRLMQSVLSRHKDEVASNLRDFFDALEQGKRLKIEEIRIAFSEIILTLPLRAKEKGLPIPSLDKKQALEHIYDVQSLGDLKKWLKQTIEKISDAPIEERDENRYVQLAKQHVHNNYSEKITLDQMAGQLFIHPAYFSSIFKKETGHNFIDYINEVRVRKAVEMLRNKDCKIKDISVMVGFHNHSYFNKVFKKVIGVKPLVFRSNHTCSQSGDLL
ncbi:response regulator [Paenibacillus sp. 2RAB27]|uniref:response regulator transcription factor n=1 Tax=Paenibacillus sp. 2RAB27 TaxID=3232991 RepID=UPI003F9DA070